MKKNDDLKIYTYCIERWAFHKRLDKGYFPSKHDKIVLEEASKKFKITVEKVQKTFDRILQLKAKKEVKGMTQNEISEKIKEIVSENQETPWGRETEEDNNEKKYFHFTLRSNIWNIIESKTLKNFGEGIYVCDTYEDLTKFILLYKGVKFKDYDDIVGIEFTTNAEFEESFDHNADLLMGAKAFVSWEDVKLNSIQPFDFKV